MDPRVRRIAEGASRRLADTTPMTAGKEPEAIRIERITLSQLAALAGSIGNDALVREVKSALQRGKQVVLYKPAVADALRLEAFSPAARQAVEELFADLERTGVTMICDKTACDKTTGDGNPTCSNKETLPSSGPESDILTEILGEAVPEDHPCYIEPGVLCFGCGRCKTLGF